MFFKLRAALTLCVLSLPVVAQAADWEERFYNPKPEAGDLVLPIPCGGSIVFREVTTPAGNGALDDRPVTLGSPDATLGYSEFVRNTFLSGGFASPQGGRRYWIGKYEITRDQYAAVTNSTCADPAADGRRAQGEVSWFDAIGFTERLSIWLLANARNKLPEQDGVRGFVRLPTEDEWEYAARGGAAVGEADFAAATFPMPDGVDRYVMAGSRRTGGRVQAIGQLEPNPLGIFDILGNVSEMTLEPYRLNRVGRAHGQAGGVIVRGGSYSDQPANIRSSQRDELPPFDAARGTPTRLPQVGFRVVLAAPATTSLPQTERVREAFTRESTAEETRARDAANDPRRALALLRERTTDQATKQALQSLDAQLASDARARADAQRQVVRAEFESMTILAYSAWDADRRAKEVRNIIGDTSLTQSMNVQDIDRYRNAADAQERVAVAVTDAYVRTLRQMAESVPRSVAAEEAAVHRRELAERGMGRFVAFNETADRHLRGAMTGTLPNREQLQRDFAAAAAQPAQSQQQAPAQQSAPQSAPQQRRR